MDLMDVVKIPIFATFSLVGLFLLFKKFDKDLINLFFRIFFSIQGGAIITNLLRDYINRLFWFLPRNDLRIIKIEKKFYGKLFLVDLTTNLLFSSFIGFAIGMAYFLTTNYLLNNVFGICFAIVGII